MLTSTFYNFWDYWELRHRVTFDGERRLIYINPNEVEISVQRDIYSAWKEWTRIYDYTKWPAAIRSVGGDPITTQLNAGDIYFLINGWQVVISTRTRVTGSLFHDDPIDPYLVLPGGGVISTVSNLVQTVNTGGAAPSDVQAIAQAVRAEMDLNSNSFASIQNQLNQLTTMISNIPGDIDLTPILQELENIKRQIDDTQAFVLSK